jgi:hypothetical protein
MFTRISRSQDKWDRGFRGNGVIGSWRSWIVECALVRGVETNLGFVGSVGWAVCERAVFSLVQFDFIGAQVLS